MQGLRQIYNDLWWQDSAEIFTILKVFESVSMLDPNTELIVSQALSKLSSMRRDSTGVLSKISQT